MAETQKIPWKRISAEIAAIIVSIILSFSIDAWWDIERESILLATLDRGFEQNRELLKEALALNQESLSTVQEFSQYLVSSNQELLVIAEHILNSLSGSRRLAPIE